MCGDPGQGGQRVGARGFCLLGLWAMAAALGKHDNLVGQSRPGKLPSTRTGAPPWGSPVPFPTGRQVGSPSPETHPPSF